MYVPEPFAVDDLRSLSEFLEENSFATLVSRKDSELCASHLPLLFESSRGKNGVLVGHFARANSQWKDADGTQVLAVFQGPHAYISPRWYGEPHVVPTWNYVAVHVSGRIRITEDRTRLLEMLRKFVAIYEQPLPDSWNLDEEANMVEQLLSGIIGFEIDIDRIEGKWKLSQNHSLQRRQNVARVLATHDDQNSQAIARLMLEQ